MNGRNEKNIYLQNRGNKKLQMHAEIQIVKTIKTTAAPSKTPLKQNLMRMENIIILPS